MPTTLVNRSGVTSKLAANLTLAQTPLELARRAAILADPNIVSWLRADSLFQTSGGSAGWRDLVTDQLFEPNTGHWPTVQNIAAYDDQASLLFGSSSSASSAFTDAGANLFPDGNQSHSLILVGRGSSGNNCLLISDGAPLSSATYINVENGGNPAFYVDGQGMATGTALSYSTPHLFITSFEYNGGGGAQQWAARIDQGAQTLSKTSGITGVPQSSTLYIGGYSGSPCVGADIAEVLVFKGSILHGSYLTNNITVTDPVSGTAYTYPLYEHIEAYIQARYGF